MSNDEIRVISKDNLKEWAQTTTNRAAALLLNDLAKIGEDILLQVKGAEPSGPSWVKKNRYNKTKNKWEVWEYASGSRTLKEWPVDTGKSRDGWRWYMRHKGDEIELVITNPVRYAFMLKASHTYKSQRAYTYLIRTPLKRNANKFAEAFSEILAREVS